MPIDTAYDADADRTGPNPHQGNYFMPEVPEGFVRPMGINEFRNPNPNPDLRIEDFLIPLISLAITA